MLRLVAGLALLIVAAPARAPVGAPARAPAPAPARAGAGCEALDALIASTYDFRPSQLTREQLSAKSAAMDGVWDMVKADPQTLLPCLRAALQAPGADVMFRFDCSTLLVELDPSTESKALQVAYYTGVALEDVDPRSWISVLSQRAFEGHDVSRAAFKWLAWPEASYSIPAHGLHEYGPMEGALFLFGSMDEAQATPALLKLIAEPEHPGRDAAVRILVNQATPEALSALAGIDLDGLSFSARTSIATLRSKPLLLSPAPVPAASRQQLVRTLQSMLDEPQGFSGFVDEFERSKLDAVALLTDDDLPLLRRARRKLATIGNFHAIGHYNEFTAVLMARTWTPELVK
jgi:hypothetical protein